MQIGMLGPFEVRTDDGELVDVPGARLRGLLVALALEPGRVVPKATLIDWIWDQSPPADAANALQRLVSRLRKLLPDGSIEGHPEGYRLRIEPDAVDAVRFERLLRPGPEGSARLVEALGLWRGAALQDVGLQDSAAFEAAVTRLEGLRLTALEDRYDAELTRGLDPGRDTGVAAELEPGRAAAAELVAELTDLVTAHPLRERLVAALMRALVATGRDSEALVVFGRTRERLADELGIDPSPELAALHVALLRGEVARPARRTTNLRAELTSYVGKDSDVAAVRELVAGHRLTTLIGPGGSGKTRLATETARTLVAEHPDGVRLVELAPISPDGDVAQAALDALGLRDTLLGDAPETEPIERFVAAVRERRLLLILDNCEHVVEAAAAFAYRVLGECRRLRILATSREPLGITGEALWPVVPLTLPAPDADATEIEAAPAVRLLRDRAEAVRGELGTDESTSVTLARVCRALDGMPLAIELAAARLRTMSLDQLADRLDDRFRLLTSGSRTALPQHRTLRAVVDWSWELLDDAERAVLRRLAVFSGGASQEAAEAICADPPADPPADPSADRGADASPDPGGRTVVEPSQVLDLLTALADKSLLVPTGDRVPRYRMLGTIQEYAGQRLAEAGESEPTRRAHLAYFTRLASTAEPHLRRAEQLEWLAVLDADHDNIAAAMRGALAAGDAAGAMGLAAAAGQYWWLAGHKAEGSELLMAAAALPGEVPDEFRGVVYAFVAGFLTSGRGSDEHQAEEWIHQVAEIARRFPGLHPAVGLTAALERLLQGTEAYASAWEPLLADPDPWARALARLQLGKMRILLGDGSRDADAELEAALVEFRALGERWGMSFALSELADRIAMRGEFARAAAYVEQAIAVVTEVGSLEDVVRMRSRQAQLHWLAGDETACAAAMADAERLAARVVWPEALTDLALAKAELARWRGDSETALRQLDIATATLGEVAERSPIRAMRHDLLGYLADDLESARTHRAAAFRAASETGNAQILAQIIVGIADLALRLEQYARAAQLLVASSSVRGLPDRALPDEARIEAATRRHLGDVEFTEVTSAARSGVDGEWREWVEVTLAS